MKDIYYVGVTSKKKFDISASQWLGENSELLDLWFKPKPNPKKFVGNLFNFWKYLDVLPIEKSTDIISLGEIITPLSEITFSNGLKTQIKQDQMFPTGSYKDRGAAVLISFLKAYGATHVIQDSSGNAGTSIAAYAARGGISCEIFLPENTSYGKILQMKAYGAKVVKIAGDRDDTAKATLIAAKEKVYASHCYNPVFLQGTKTFVYELIEQLNYKSPRAIVVPAGNGTLLLGCYLGLKELYEAGLIQSVPKLIAVQTEACNPLFRKYFGLNQMEKATKTIAEGIAILNPVREKQMLEAVIETGGTFISVTDNEVIETWKEVSKQGFFIEPTSAATIAGLLKYADQIENSNDIVSLFSGNGLKSLEKINQFAFES